MKNNYVVIKENGGRHLDVGKKTLDKIQKPLFLLNLDENLSLFHGNPEYFNLLGGDSSSFRETYSNFFKYTLVYQHQTTFMDSLKTYLAQTGSMKKVKKMDQEVDIITETGEVRSLFLSMKAIIHGTEKLLLGTFHHGTVPSKFFTE